MNKAVVRSQMIAWLLAATVLAGCAGPAPAAPTAAPTRSYTVVSSPQSVIGLWRGAFHLMRIDNDGTFRFANAVPQLQSDPLTILSYRFEGNKMLIATLSAFHDAASCSGMTGTYELQLTEGGGLNLNVLNDACAERAGDIYGHYDKVK